MTRTTSRKILPYDKLDVMDIIKRWRELLSVHRGRGAARKEWQRRLSTPGRRPCLRIDVDSVD